MENAISRRPSAKRTSCSSATRGGDRSAIIYSIIVSCQRRASTRCLHGDVLSRLPSMTNQDDLAP